MPPGSPCNAPPTWFHPWSGAPIEPRPASSPGRTPSPIPSPARSSFSGWSDEHKNTIMKMKDFSLLPVLIAVLSLLPAGRVTAQTFTTLHSFTATPFVTNRDGANPYGGLSVSPAGNTFYGTASIGGSAGYGSVFPVKRRGP